MQTSAQLIQVCPPLLYLIFQSCLQYGQHCLLTWSYMSTQWLHHAHLHGYLWIQMEDVFAVPWQQTLKGPCSILPSCIPWQGSIFAKSSFKHVTPVQALIGVMLGLMGAMQGFSIWITDYCSPMIYWMIIQHHSHHLKCHLLHGQMLCKDDMWDMGHLSLSFETPSLWQHGLHSVTCLLWRRTWSVQHVAQPLTTLFGMASASLSIANTSSCHYNLQWQYMKTRWWNRVDVYLTCWLNCLMCAAISRK